MDSTSNEYKSIRYFLSIKFFLFSFFFFLFSYSYSSNSNRKDSVNHNSINNYFEKNLGQIIDENSNLVSEVHFSTHLNGLNVFFTNKGLVYYYKEIKLSRIEMIKRGLILNPYTNEEWKTIMEEINSSDSHQYDIIDTTRMYRVDIEFSGGNFNNPVVNNENKLVRAHDYYTPQFPNGLRGVPCYNKITYSEVYNGIDLIYYFENGQLKYDFIIKPYADPNQIKIVYKGVDGIELSQEGEAIAKSFIGNFIEKAPYTYQGEKTIKSKFQINEDTLSFTIDRYDQSQVLIIDPELSWATYYPTDKYTNYTSNHAYDSKDNLYFMASSAATNYPVINPGGSTYYLGTGTASENIVLHKFNNKRELIWCTYYRGSASTSNMYFGKNVLVDHLDNVYIKAWVKDTRASSGPTTTTIPTYNPGGGAYYQTQTHASSSGITFLVKFDQNGERKWATIFAAPYVANKTDNISVYDFDIDIDNRLYLTGKTYTSSSSWGTIPIQNKTGAYNVSTSTMSEAPWVAQFSATGVLEWSTYISQGPAGTYHQGYTISTGVDGEIFVTGSGSTNATTNFTTITPTSAYQDKVATAGRKIAIYKFSSNRQLTWATLFGGDTRANTSNIIWQDPYRSVTSSEGDLYIVGRANTNNFPTLSSGSTSYTTSTKPSNDSNNEGVIIRFSKNGVLKWSTYYGATVNLGQYPNTEISTIGISNTNTIVIAGQTNSFGMTSVSSSGDYSQPTTGNKGSVFLATFNASNEITWASYYGHEIRSAYQWGMAFGSRSFDCNFKFSLSGWLPKTNDLPQLVNPGNGAFYSSIKNTTISTNIISEFQSMSNTAASTAPTSISGASTVCKGTSITLTATGGVLGTGAEYEWGTGSVIGNNIIAGAVGESYNTPIIMNNTTFWVRRKDAAPCNTRTTGISITVTPSQTLNPGTITTPQIICHGETPALLTGSAPSGGIGSNAYLWEQQINCTGNWTNAIGTNTSTNYQPGILTESTCYRRKVTNECGVVYSKPVSITSDLKLHYSFDEFSEPTQNLIPGNVASFNSYAGWNCSEDNPLNVTREILVTQGYQGRNATKITKTAAASGGYFQVGLDIGFPISFPANTTFTASVKYKRQDASTNFGIGDWTGPDGNNPGWSTISDEAIDNGWRLRVVRRTYVNASSGGFTFGINSTSPNKWIIFSDFQLEKKEHATPFVIGTRSPVPVIDQSSNNNHGSIELATSPKWIPEGADGGAYDFDGTPTKVIKGNVGLPAQNWTISLWVMKRAHTVGSYPIFLSFSLPYIACDNSSSPFRLSYTASSQESTVGTTVPLLNRWYHVVATSNSTGTKLYVDGVLEGSNILICTNTGGAFDIGRHLNSDNYRINGGVDDVRIYSKALTPEEVKTLYESKSLKITLPPRNSILANNGEEATCRVRGNNWVHFYQPSSGNLIGSVNANGGDLGNVTMKAYVDGTSQLIPDCFTSSPVYATSVMQRHWQITPGTQGQASVRLPFKDGELSNLATAANGNSNPTDNVSSISSIKLSKYSGPLNVNGSAIDNCTNAIPSPGSGGTTLHAQTSNGIISGITFPTAVPTSSFVQFAITSFSEFWLHGNTSSPLPVKLTNFSANCNQDIQIYWTTASEQNSDKFVLEKSRDLQNWFLVSEQIAAGNSSTDITYNEFDRNSWNGETYYRLKQIDFNGMESVYGPISISCGLSTNDMIVYPNPNHGDFTVEINSTEDLSHSSIQLIDMTGRVVLKRDVYIQSGKTQVLFENLNLEMGSYIVKVWNNEEFKPIKIIIN